MVKKSVSAVPQTSPTDVTSALCQYYQEHVIGTSNVGAERYVEEILQQDNSIAYIFETIENWDEGGDYVPGLMITARSDPQEPQLEIDATFSVTLPGDESRVHRMEAWMTAYNTDPTSTARLSWEMLGEGLAMTYFRTITVPLPRMMSQVPQVVDEQYDLVENAFKLVMKNLVNAVAEDTSPRV